VEVKNGEEIYLPIMTLKSISPIDPVPSDSHHEFGLSMKEMIDASVHFGHEARRWCPLMAPYIFDKTRDGVHVIDLRKTYTAFHRALENLRDIVSEGGRILFVGRKPQARRFVKETAQNCGQYYIDQKWPGGMLTNWKTIYQSLEAYESTKLSVETAETLLEAGLLPKGQKKELIHNKKIIQRYSKYEGIIGMKCLPDALFIFSTKEEAVAIAEANRLGIPIIGITDTNASPKGIQYMIPGNDDSIRAIEYYCSLAGNAVRAGLEKEAKIQEKDLGAFASMTDMIASTRGKKDSKEFQEKATSGRKENMFGSYRTDHSRTENSRIESRTEKNFKNREGNPASIPFGEKKREGSSVVPQRPIKTSENTSTRSPGFATPRASMQRRSESSKTTTSSESVRNTETRVPQTPRSEKVTS
jgi:small subunit ribosomal protein S2